MIKKTGLIYFFLLAILLAGCASSKPEIVLEMDQYDFGDVVNGEVVNLDISVQNEGDAPLLVDSVSTSCGCTKASLDSMSIPPGENALLHIEFDSGAHGPELTGELIRQVFVNSNDPANPEVVVELAANIIKGSSP